VVTQTIVPLNEKIFKKVFNQSFTKITETLQMEKADNNNFDYLLYLKSYPLEVTDSNAPILKNTTFFVINYFRGF
jgi:hypothetical protein